MIWFYSWCAFIAFVMLSIPTAALLEKRALAGPSPRRSKKAKDDEALEEGEEAEFAEEAEEVEFAGEVDDAEELGEMVDDLDEIR